LQRREQRIAIFGLESPNLNARAVPQGFGDGKIYDIGPMRRRLRRASRIRAPDVSR